MGTHIGLYTNAFIQGDAAAIERQVDWAKGKPNEFNMVAAQAAAAAFSGKLQQSRELRRRAAELAKSRNFLEPAANITSGGAWVEANVGNYGQAREAAAAALGIHHNAGVGAAASVFALAGDAPRAQALAEELAKRFPSDTFVRSVALPAIRASIEISRGNPAKAIELLQAATPYENGLFEPQYMRDRKSTRLNSSHIQKSRMPSSA